MRHAYKIVCLFVIGYKIIKRLKEKFIARNIGNSAYLNDAAVKEITEESI